MIDSIINASGTPYSALHDIDANKPGGSIAIRVRTYAHTLHRHEEELEDLATRKTELERRVEAKRRELLESRRQAVQAAAGETGREMREMAGAYSTYLETDEPPRAFTVDDLKRLDVNPLPPTEAAFVVRGGRVEPEVEVASTESPR
jgi:hypothetical protein